MSNPIYDKCDRMLCNDCPDTDCLGKLVDCAHLESDKIYESVIKLDDGFAIQGCCGGGCVVITGIKYCPFCGKLLQVKK